VLANARIGQVAEYVRNVPAPVAMGQIAINADPGIVTLPFRAILGIFDVSKVAKGQIAFSTLLAPQLFNNTYIGGQAALYQKYRFTELRAHVKATAPTTVGGNYVAGIVSDPSATPSTPGLGNVQWITSLAGSTDANVYLSSCATLHCSSAERRQKWFLTGLNDEPDDAIQASFILAMAAPVSNITGGGPVSLEISIEGVAQFMGPKAATDTQEQQGVLRIPPDTSYPFATEYAETPVSFVLHDGVISGDPVHGGEAPWPTIIGDMLSSQAYEVVPPLVYTSDVGVVTTAQAVVWCDGSDSTVTLPLPNVSMAFFDTIENAQAAKNLNATGLCAFHVPFIDSQQHVLLPVPGQVAGMKYSSATVKPRLFKSKLDQVNFELASRMKSMHLRGN